MKNANKNKHGSGEELNTIRGMLNSVPEEDSAAEPVEAIPRNRSKFRRRLYSAVGILLVLMSAVGLISTIVYAKEKISYIVNNTEQKNEFAKTIYPLVICDPSPFDDPAKLRNETIISAACWDIILNSDKSAYEHSFDYIKVPETDIEKHAADLFGEGLTIEHTSVINTDLQFYYDPSVNSYRIPSNPKYFSYSPKVESISVSGDTYTLQVGYISPTPAWIAEFYDDEPEPEKYVVYVLKKQSSEYVISAVKQSELMTDSESGL